MVPAKVILQINKKISFFLSSVSVYSTKVAE